MDWTEVQSQHTKEENYLSFNFLTSVLFHLNNRGSAQDLKCVYGQANYCTL